MLTMGLLEVIKGMEWLEVQAQEGLDIMMLPQVEEEDYKDYQVNNKQY